MDSAVNFIHAYNLERPTASDLYVSLCDLVGQEDTTFAVNSALRQTQIRPEELEELESERLLQLAFALTRQRGLVSIVARSFVIRVQTFRELSRSAEAA